MVASASERVRIWRPLLDVRLSSRWFAPLLGAPWWAAGVRWLVAYLVGNLLFSLNPRMGLWNGLALISAVRIVLWLLSWERTRWLRMEEARSERERLAAERLREREEYIEEHAEATRRGIVRSRSEVDAV